MDKLKTKILLISLLLVLLLSLQGVSAVTDDNGNLTSQSIDLSICHNTDDANPDKLSTADTSNNQDEALSDNPDTSTYSELASEIANGRGIVVLQHDYYTYDEGSTITISDNIKTLDGNGAVIDMAGSNIQAFYVNSEDVTIKNLTIKNVNYNGQNHGGAIYFYRGGTVEDCNFINNSASRYGGAIFFNDYSTVENCNFINNTAYGAAAILFMTEGIVTNCNFTNNTATNGDGGALYMKYGSVENCNFTNNTATRYGGAIIMKYGSVKNCNFTGNNATNGSAIYFSSTSVTKTVSNSRFLNNRANAEELQVTKNDNNITITFTGKDNLLNAIYSETDVRFTNVFYWSAEGITNTGSSAIKPSRSNKEAGQNITVCVVVNGVLVLNEVKVTDENGMIVLDVCAGDDYFISARHDADSYYTEAVKTNSTMKFNVNVTSQTSTNRTVNITAKSNIPNEIIKGELQFILPDSAKITANYTGNGNWWALYTFADYGVYEVNASYTGLDKVAVNNANITVNKANSTLTVENIVFDYNSTGSTSV